MAIQLLHGRVSTLEQTIDRVYDFRDDWVSGTTAGETNWATATSGSGAVALATTNVAASHHGIVELQRGTTAISSACLNKGSASIALGGSDVVFECVVMFGANLPDATNNYQIHLGLGDDTATGEHVDGVYFLFDRASSTTNWMIATASNSTRTKTDSAIAASAATWIGLGFAVNSDASSVEYYINGTSVGTVTTNIPSGASRLLGPNLKLVGSAGTSDRTFSIDAARYRCRFGTAREASVARV